MMKVLWRKKAGKGCEWMWGETGRSVPPTPSEPGNHRGALSKRAT